MYLKKKIKCDIMTIKIKKEANIMKKIILSILLITLLLPIVTACQKEESKIVKAEIIVRDKGTIKLELDAKTAPITVDNFVSLAKSGFYDGLTFHRIINGFMIQGGDPEGTGYGGSEKTIKGEFSANGIKNDISHVRGVISMARNSINMNSASSQFFIMQADNLDLDGNYAAFGHVTEGMEIVDDIAKNTKVEDGNGTTLKENQPIIDSIKIIE